MVLLTQPLCPHWMKLMLSHLLTQRTLETKELKLSLDNKQKRYDFVYGQQRSRPLLSTLRISTPVSKSKNLYPYLGNLSDESILVFPFDDFFDSFKNCSFFTRTEKWKADFIFQGTTKRFSGQSGFRIG